MSSKVRDWSFIKGQGRKPSGSNRKNRSRRPGIEGLESRALLTTLIGLTSNDVLLQFDTASPGTIQRTIPITGMPTGQKIVSIATENQTGNLLALGNDSKIYKINESTGAVTAISSTAFSPSIIGSQFAISVSPVTDVIRLVDDGGQNLRISPTTGQVTSSDQSLAYATGDSHMANSPNLGALAGNNVFNGSSTTTLYGIDTLTNSLVQLGSTGGTPTSANTGQLTTVGTGGLGVTIGSSLGFVITGANGFGYAAMTPTASGSTTGFYTISLATGAATKTGTLGDGSATIIGLAGFALTVPSAPKLSAASDSGSSNSDHITNVKTPTITGTANPNATILAQNSTTSVQLGIGKADAFGNYSFPLSSLADGTYNVTVLQGDGSGLYSTASPAMSPALVIKTSAATPGVPTLFSSSDTGFSNTDHYTRVNTPSFYGNGESVSGFPDTVQLFANGALIATGQVQSQFGQYALTSSLLADGSYQITAQQTDVAGNVSPVSAPMTPTLVVDTSSRPTPTETFINQVYLDLLGRPADQVAFTHWTPVVTGPSGRAAVVQGVIASNEYRQEVVTKAYQSLLHRAPEASALTIGANYLLTHTNQQLKAILVGSGEYFQLHGSTNSSFLAAAYQDLLGRPIDSAGQNKYLSALANGLAPMNVALIIMTSAEGQAYTATGVFQSLLHRTPDSTSLTNMVNILSSGGTDESIITILAGSQEYYQNARGSDVVVNQWAQQAYLDILGRAATSSEVANIKAQINTGATPAQVLLNVFNSTEYQTMLVKQAYQNVLQRAPEAAAITGGIAFLNAGGNIQKLEAQLFGSQEYFQNFGGGTNATYLATIYQAILGRPIDSGAANAGLQQLNAGGSRVAIAQNLLLSLEGSQSLVKAVYATYLRRQATFAEITGVGSAINKGTLTFPQLQAALVGSQEYFSGL